METVMGTTTKDNALQPIIDRAQLLAQRRDQLGTMVKALNDGIEALKADCLPEIKAAIDNASAAWLALESDVRAHPELFVKPRTLKAHGIAFGFAKGKGGLEIANPDRTVKLIRKWLPELEQTLIAVRETPVKDALSQLAADDLKRLGVEVKGTGDVVVIRPVDGEVEKLVRALVRAATDDDAPDQG
jgi:hypothetical protein